MVYSERPPDTSPIRENIESFIELRNKIKHCHAETTRALVDLISGESDAFLLNYEKSPVAGGSSSKSLAAQLKFPFSLGGFTERGKTGRGKEELLRQSLSLPNEYPTFIADYYTSLEDDVLAVSRFRLRLAPVFEEANRSGDWSMTFVNPHDLGPKERETLEQRLKHGALVSHEEVVPVANQGLLKSKQAQELVARLVSCVFNQNESQLVYQTKKCRPPNRVEEPTWTIREFRIYDEPNKKPLNSPAWVRYLVRKRATEAGFREAKGREPKVKALEWRLAGPCVRVPRALHNRREQLTIRWLSKLV